MILYIPFNNDNIQGHLSFSSASFIHLRDNSGLAVSPLHFTRDMQIRDCTLDLEVPSLFQGLPDSEPSSLTSESEIWVPELNIEAIIGAFKWLMDAGLSCRHLSLHHRNKLYSIAWPFCDDSIKKYQLNLQFKGSRCKLLAFYPLSVALIWHFCRGVDHCSRGPNPPGNFYTVTTPSIVLVNSTATCPPSTFPRTLYHIHNSK